jgi:DNA-binding NarL/FixJ family response regulator
MPQMDGLEALPRIREVLPGSRVVLFTGFLRAALADEARACGADALLEKGLGMKELVDKLRQVCRSG